MYTQQFQVVFRFLLSLTHDTALAEELTQETFYKAMKNIDGYEKKSKASTWLCQIAKNTYFSYQRKNRRLTHELPEAQDTRDGLSQLLHRENIETLHQALHSLPDPYKEVFSLRVFADLGYPQLAALFGRSENWVRVAFYRAKMKIMQIMEASEHD